MEKLKSLDNKITANSQITIMSKWKRIIFLKKKTIK